MYYELGLETILKEREKEWKIFWESLDGVRDEKIASYIVKIMVQLSKKRDPLKKAERKFREKEKKLNDGEIQLLVETIVQFHPKGEEFRKLIKK